MPEYAIHDIQLMDHNTRETLIAAGGVAYVVAAGEYAKATLYDPDNGFQSVSNPVDLTRGKIRFATDVSVSEVDVYGVSGEGVAFQAYGLKPGALAELYVDALRADHKLVIPFAQADQAGDNTETDTGFDEPTNAVFTDAFINVKTADSGETIDVGTDGNGDDDPDGFAAGLALDSTGVVKTTLTNGSQTKGVLLSADEDGAGALVPEGHVGAGESITWTLSSGADAAAGLIVLPYILAE
jgi:hypothetical protein